MPLYSATNLDSDGDGKVKLVSKSLTGANGNVYKKGSTIFPCPDAPVIYPDRPYCYVGQGEACPVAAPPPPPPPPPPPVDTLAILSGGSAFLQNDRLSVGINEAGNLVAKSAPPAGIRYASEMGAKTVGLCLVQPDGSLFDYINDAGTRFDQFMVSRGSKDWTNARHLGLVEIAGGKLSVADGAALYEAKTPDGIPLSIRYTLDGASLIMAFTLGAPANLLYSTDPDLLDYPTEAGSDYGITTNTPMHNAIEAVRGNRKLRIEGVGGEPVIGSGRVYDDAALTPATAAVKSDQSIGLLFRGVSSATVRLSVG